MPRLIDQLKSLGYSNRAAREAMATGKVFYRGIPTVDGGREVDPADVKVDVDAPRVVVGRDPLFLHIDAAVVVVYKPPGVLSVSAPNRRDEGSLVGFVSRKLGKALAVHRLDEGTSGLMVVARTEAAQEALKDAFERHEVERRYLAIVHATFPAEPRTVRTTLIRDRGDGLRGSYEVAREKAEREAAERPGERVWWPRNDGKPAVTHLRRVGVVAKNASIVEARLETGRTHQVRIHLAEAGFPVLGDPLYAPRHVANRAPRLALHAAVLGFPHPDGRTLRFEAPLADDLEAWCRENGGVTA